MGGVRACRNFFLFIYFFKQNSIYMMQDITLECQHLGEFNTNCKDTKRKFD